MESDPVATSPTHTFSQGRLPWLLRLANGCGRTLRRRGLWRQSLAPDHLKAIASRRTRLYDWGEEPFEEALTVLVGSFEAEADLTPLGRLGLKQDLLRLLANRLRMQAHFVHHSAIRDEHIERPLFIVGLPRTGTTMLFNLLAQDPAVRSPKLWELLWPLPLRPDRKDRRVALTKRLVRRMYWAVPPLRAVHPMEAEGPEECLLLFEHMFTSIDFAMRADVPSYLGWLLRRDLEPEYRYYRAILQLLQFQHPLRRWLLKSPFHLFDLPALLSVFPDAAIVQTHRDPRAVVPSFCSLAALMHRPHSDALDPRRLGRQWLEVLAAIMQRSAEVRAQAPASFFDVHYRGLIDDPKGTVERIYDYFQLPFTDAMAAGIEGWLARHPQHRHGVHRYSAASFGLTDEQILERFASAGPVVPRSEVKKEF